MPNSPVKKPPATTKVVLSNPIDLQLQEGKPISENMSLSRENEADYLIYYGFLFPIRFNVSMFIPLLKWIAK